MIPPIVSIAISQIGELSADEYVGLVDVEAVRGLEARLAVDGLLTPIWVRWNGADATPEWSVIAGRHRLRAAKALGWTIIDAQQRADIHTTAYGLRQLQIVENLDRRDLRPIERSRFVMDRWAENCRAFPKDEPTNQQGRAIRARWDTLAAVANTPNGDRSAADRATATACGKSERWVRECRALFEATVAEMPDHYERLNAHQLGESRAAMIELVKLPLPERLKVAELIVDHPAIGSMNEAMVRAGLRDSNGTRHDPTKSDARFWNDWNAMAREQRHANFLRLAQDIPDSWISETIDALRALLP